MSHDFMNQHHDVSVNLQNPSNLPTHYSSYMQSQAHMVGKAPTSSNPLNLVGVLSESSNNHMNISSNSRLRPQRE